MSKELIRTIGTGTVVTSVGTVFVKVVGIGATFLTLHRLTVYEYGLTELAISVIPLLSIFLLPGIANVVIAEMGIAKGEGKIGKAKALFNDFFQHQLFLAVFGWATVFFGAGLIAHLYNQNIADLFRIASFSFLLGPFRTNFQAALRVDLKFFALTAFGMVEECVKISVLAYCFFILDLSMKGVLYAYVLNEAITLILFSPVFLAVYRRWGAADTDIAHPFRLLFMQYGKWTILTNYLNNFSINIRLWIIKAFLGTETVGLFALASGLYSHTQALFPLTGILTPILPQYISQKERLYQLIVKGIKYQMAVFVVLGVGAAVVFPFLISSLFPKYALAMPMYLLILFTLFPNSFSSIFTATFTAIRAQRSLFFSTLMKTVSILVLGAPCYMFFGAMGVPLEFFLTTSFFVLERYRSLRRLLPGFSLSHHQFWRIDDDDRMIISAIRHRIWRGVFRVL